jgi:hypothetical protein
MTSVSSANYLSPLQQLQKELASEVSSGKISSADATALSSALTDIDSSLQSGISGTQSGPTDLKSKIDNLIASEVSSGKLTSNQATELKDVFKNAIANGGAGSSSSDSGSSSSTDSTSVALGSIRRHVCFYALPGAGQGCTKVGKREGFKPERDAMASRRHYDGAEQEGGPQHRCRLAVDLCDPTGIVQVMQHKEAVRCRCRDKLYAAGI